MPYKEGAEYRDVWNDKEVDVTVRMDMHTYLQPLLHRQLVQL